MSWPKPRPVLSDADIAINEDWQVHWLTQSQNRFSGVQAFNHGYVLRSGRDLVGRTLEIGAGGGEHINLEKAQGTLDDYNVLELRPDLASIVRQRFPDVKVAVGDCQERLPFEVSSLSRIIAIHVLEHLDNLPAFLAEGARALQPEGRLLAVIPCEGGVGYTLGRQMTSKRQFERRYKKPYEPFIRAEHLNNAREILGEVRRHFQIESAEYWPLRVPLIDLNLCIGLRLAPLSKGRPGSR